jgi:diaminohydroxyphosphoribosylaminopyrimidine deaminase/5-amino-6-(5-phosphoribosylamino)uracil reductase
MDKNNKVEFEELKENQIYFYEFFENRSKPEHKFLNNFHESPFTTSSGVVFTTVEHYYQAHKFGDFKKKNFEQYFEEIRKAENADKCKKIARSYTKNMSPDEWNENEWNSKLKDYYMKRGLMYKFSQNKDMLDLLVKTGNAELREDSLKDKYWGGLIKGSSNMLGIMLMQLRDNYVKSKVVFLEGSGLEPIKI